MKFAHKYHLRVLWNWNQWDMDVLACDAKDVCTLLIPEKDDFVVNITIQLLERDFQQVKDGLVCKVLD